MKPWRAALPMLSLFWGLCVQGNGQTPSDPAFHAVPFEQWIAAGEKPQIKWEVRVLVPTLSASQRLVSRAEIQVDGDEVTRRRGRGGLVMLVQYADSQGRLYRTHNVLDLRSIDKDTNKLNFVYTQDAFVLPGDYRLSFAVFDTENMEYSATQRMLRVPPLKSDPLPRSWEGMPSVELPDNHPESLEMPAIRGVLNLPLETRRPVQLQLLVNMSPSTIAAGGRTSPVPQNIIIGRLLTSLRVLSQIRVRNGTFDIALLDIVRRRVIFEQDGAKPLDWQGVQAALKSADPKVIDAASLRNRGKSAQFFVEQVRKRIPTAEAAPEAAVGPAKVLLMLTSPIEFEPGEEVRPIEGGVAPNTLIYFLRQHVLPPRAGAPVLDDFRFGRRNFPPPLPTRTGYQESIDQLQGTIKSIKPKVLDIYTPEDFRKALAQILEEAGRL